MAITETNDKKRAQNPSIREPLCEVKTSIVGFIALYALITIGFVAIGPKLFSSTWVSSSDFHSCIEITSSFIAIIAAIACLMHYFGFKSRFYLICGLGFFICGGEDFIHGLLSFTRLFSGVEADLSRFVPGTYVAGRSAFAIFIILAAVLGDRSLAVKNIRKETFLFSSLAFIVGGLMTAIAIILPLPQFIYPERLISRPVDFVSAVLFAIAFAVVLRRYLRGRSIFSGFLLACILLNLGGQIYMSFSKQLFDAFFDTAHWANIMSYCMPVLGITVQAREGMKKSKRELTARTQSERELQLHRDHLEQLVEERTHELAERVKELDCLYRVSRLATESDKTTNEFFEGVVGLIPPSWQYPEITCARIAVNGQEFMTDNFEQTIWKQSADIVASGEKIGSVEVYDLQDKPVIDEGPFLKEERHLIDALGRQLGIIFERKKAEKTLERLNENLEDTIAKLGRANNELKDFVYIASHDLREPMRKISSFGELLSSSLKGKLNDDDKENLGFMVDGAKRMQQMIDALRTYSRVTTGGAEFEPVDLNKVVEELCTVELAVKIEEIGAKIMTPEQLHNVNCDPTQIRQLMQNLIANGLKYQKEGVVPEITIRSSVTDNDMIRVEVLDNGIGIKQEQFKNIFVMFKRLHSRQEYEGAGIGLAVCKKIVERHKGGIGVSSTYGQGSTFWFTLPALKTPAEKQSETSVALRV